MMTITDFPIVSPYVASGDPEEIAMGLFANLGFVDLWPAADAAMRERLREQWGDDWEDHEGARDDGDREEEDTAIEAKFWPMFEPGHLGIPCGALTTNALI
jgi:hypothetical protein